ncbi:MAG: TlpA disulfide reductase family protein [Polyangiaceae bacterium]
MMMRSGYAMGWGIVALLAAACTGEDGVPAAHTAPLPPPLPIAVDPSRQPGQTDGSGASSPLRGHVAPPIEGRSPSGTDTVSFATTGDVLVLHFWATWCGPCKSAMRALDDLATRSAGRVRVVGLSVDDEPDAIAEFARSLQLRFPIAWDRGLVTANRYRPATMPSTFVIDARGVVRHELHGWHEGDVAILEGVISDLAH